MDEIGFESHLEDFMEAKKNFRKYLEGEIKELRRYDPKNEELFERICAFTDILLEFDECFSGCNY